MKAGFRPVTTNTDVYNEKEAFTKRFFLFYNNILNKNTYQSQMTSWSLKIKNNLKEVLCETTGNQTYDVWQQVQMFVFGWLLQPLHKYIIYMSHWIQLFIKQQWSFFVLW